MDLLWLIIHFGLALAIAGGMLAASYVLGERHREELTGKPYESGIKITRTKKTTYSAQFYLVAVFFVIFDLEAVFLFTWAVAASEAGWAGYIEMLVFVGILLVALGYLWRLGALDWGPMTRMKTVRQLPPCGDSKEEEAAQ